MSEDLKAENERLKAEIERLRIALGDLRMEMAEEIAQLRSAIKMGLDRFTYEVSERRWGETGTKF